MSTSSICKLIVVALVHVCTVHFIVYYHFDSPTIFCKFLLSHISFTTVAAFLLPIRIHTHTHTYTLLLPLFSPLVGLVCMQYQQKLKAPISIKILLNIFYLLRNKSFCLQFDSLLQFCENLSLTEEQFTHRMFLWFTFYSFKKHLKVTHSQEQKEFENECGRAEGKERERERNK